MTHHRLLPWLMWFFPLTFFGFQFILRLFPGLVMPEFLAKYHINATDFGIFVSLYYLGYAGMQIPVAILLDKYGPRRIISISAVLCGMATWMFIAFDAWPVALVSRFLIGVGSIVGFLGTSKVISLWFPKEHYARMVGLTFSFGLLGALYGGRPTSALIQQWGWEKVSLILGATAVSIGIMIFIFVRSKKASDNPQNKEEEQKLPIKMIMKNLLANRSLVLLGIANLFMVGSLEGFADVWGVPYLVASKNITTTDAASITSFIFVGMLFGGPILAFISEKYKAHYMVTLACGVLMAALLGGLLLFNAWLSPAAIMVIMFLIGILCCYQVIVFAIGAELVPLSLLSITMAFLNFLNMLGGSFFHSAIGRLMDYFEPSTIADGAVTYSVESFTSTLTLIPVMALLGAVLVWYSRPNKSISGERA